MADATRSLKIVVEEERKGDGYTQAANDIDKYSRGVSDADARTKKWTEDSARLNDEISKSKLRIRELHEEVAKTGDTGLFGDIRKEESRLKSFENTLKALTPAAEQAGVEVGSSFFGGFADAFKDFPFKGVLIGGLVAVAIAAAPAVGAILSGAVLGVAGLGGIAGGIFAASKNQDVRDAASELGQTVMAQFFGDGSAMVKPLIGAIHILEEDFAKLDLAKTFRTLAPYVEQVAHGIGGLAGEFLPRFNDALAKGGPALTILGKLLPQIGVALGEFFQNLAGSKGTFEGLALGLNLTANLIKGLGKSLGWLGDQFDGMIRFTDSATKHLDEFLRKLHIALPFLGVLDHNLQSLLSVGDGTASMFHDLATWIDETVSPTAALRRETQRLADEIKRLDDAARSYFALTMSLDQADAAVAQSFLDLRTNLIKGKQNWAENTQAGHDNIAMVESSISTIEQLREKAIDAANGNKAAIDKANAAYEEQFQKILAVAKAAGDSQAALKALAGKYDVEVILHASLVDDIKSLGNVGKIASAVLASYFPHRAAGGSAMTGQPLWVGEQGPEMFVPQTNGYILPHGATGGGGSAGQPIVISFARTGDTLLDAILTILRKYIQVQGGDVQFALMG